MGVKPACCCCDGCGLVGNQGVCEREVGWLNIKENPKTLGHKVTVVVLVSVFALVLREVGVGL
jgi:hypothetical protein